MSSNSIGGMPPVAYSGQKNDQVGLQATGNGREHVHGRAIGLAQPADAAQLGDASAVSVAQRSQAALST
jgi:hypothetical protein